MNNQAVGNQIAEFRKNKGLTQNDLGERLGVTFQAVSKWERGECLPDTALLPDLAMILETTIDSLLCHDKLSSYNKKITVANIISGLKCLESMGDLLGRNNLIYRHAIEGINHSMNTDIEAAFDSDYVFEAFVTEAILANLDEGAYIDLSDVKKNFKHDHFRNIILETCKKRNIK